MPISLKDLQTDKDFLVAGPSATLGRDAARCTVAITDKSVSNVHARLWSTGGRWFIEDQGSSNGTYLAGKRIAGAAELHEGDELALFRYRLRVNRIDPSGKAMAPGPRFDPGAATQMLVVIDGPPAPLAATAAARTGGAPEPLARPPPMGKSNEHSPGPAAHRTGYGEGTDRVPPGQVESSYAGGKSAFVATIKVGFAYYLAALWPLARHPLVTTRTMVDESPLPAMEKMELAAFAAPAFVLGALASAAASLVVSIVAHAALVSSVISAVIALAIAALSGVVGGYVLHPVLRWLIRLLAGESNNLSRTNYGVASFTAVALTQIVGACGILIGLIPLPFVNLVALVLSLLGSLLVLYVSYVWLKRFGVTRFAPIVILALMVVSGASSARSLFYGVRADLGGGPAGTSATGLIAPTADAGTGGTGAGEADGASGAVSGSGAGAVGATAGGVGDGAAAPSRWHAWVETVRAWFGRGSGGANGGLTTTTLVPVKVLADTTPNAGGGTTSGGTNALGAADSPGSAGTSATDPTGSAGGTTLPATAPGDGQRTSYAEYQRRLDAIEKAMAADPTLLTRAVGVRPLYKKLHDETARIAKKEPKAKPKDHLDDAYQDRWRQAQLYEATYATVDELYAKAVAQPVFASPDAHGGKGSNTKKKVGKGKGAGGKAKVASPT